MKNGFYLSPCGNHIIELKEDSFCGITTRHTPSNTTLWQVNTHTFNLKLWSFEIEVIFSHWDYLGG